MTIKIGTVITETGIAKPFRPSVELDEDKTSVVIRTDQNALSRPVEITCVSSLDLLIRLEALQGVLATAVTQIRQAQPKSETRVKRTRKPVTRN